MGKEHLGEEKDEKTKNIPCAEIVPKLKIVTIIIITTTTTITTIIC